MSTVRINVAKIFELAAQKPANENKELLDEVFVISGIIKVEVSVISRSRRLRLITLTEKIINKII